VSSFRIDPYLAKQFREGVYNCFDLVREAWLELTGVDLGAQTPPKGSGESYEARALKVANTLRLLSAKEDPCIVLMRRKRLEPHVGIYYKGRILHMNSQGAEYRDFSQVTAPYTLIDLYGNPC
jgi:hypothetical protein